MPLRFQLCERQQSLQKLKVARIWSYGSFVSQETYLTDVHYAECQAVIFDYLQEFDWWLDYNQWPSIFDVHSL